MRLEFDDGTLLLRDALDDGPLVEWNDRASEHGAQTQLYRSLLNRADAGGSVGGFTNRSRSRHPKSEM